jgi:hypothetical protein
VHIAGQLSNPASADDALPVGEGWAAGPLRLQSTGHDRVSVVFGPKTGADRLIVAPSMKKEG